MKEALVNLIEKDRCQEILKQHGVPVPNYAVIHQDNLAYADRVLEEAGVSFPVFVKPTDTAGSRGISENSVTKGYCLSQGTL